MCTMPRRNRHRKRRSRKVRKHKLNKRQSSPDLEQVVAMESSMIKSNDNNYESGDEKEEADGNRTLSLGFKSMNSAPRPKSLEQPPQEQQIQESHELRQQQPQEQQIQESLEARQQQPKPQEQQIQEQQPKLADIKLFDLVPIDRDLESASISSLLEEPSEGTDRVHNSPTLNENMPKPTSSVLTICRKVSSGEQAKRESEGCEELTTSMATFTTSSERHLITCRNLDHPKPVGYILGKVSNIFSVCPTEERGRQLLTIGRLYGRQYPGDASWMNLISLETTAGHGAVKMIEEMDAKRDFISVMPTLGAKVVLYDEGGQGVELPSGSVCRFDARTMTLVVIYDLVMLTAERQQQQQPPPPPPLPPQQQRYRKVPQGEGSHKVEVLSGQAKLVMIDTSNGACARFDLLLVIEEERETSFMIDDSLFWDHFDCAARLDGNTKQDRLAVLKSNINKTLVKSNLKDPCLDNKTVVKSNIKEVTSKIKAMVKSDTKELTSKIKAMAESVGKELSSEIKPTTIKSNFREVTSKTKEMTKSDTKELTSKIKAMDKTDAKELTSKIKTMAESDAKELSADIKTTAIKSNVKEVTSKIKSEVKELPADFKTTAIKSNAKARSPDPTTTIKSSIKDLPSGIKTTKLLVKSETALKRVTSKDKLKLTSKLGPIQSKIPSSVGKVKSKTKTTKNTSKISNTLSAGFAKSAINAKSALTSSVLSKITSKISAGVLSRVSSVLGYQPPKMDSKDSSMPQQQQQPQGNAKSQEPKSGLGRSASLSSLDGSSSGDNVYPIIYSDAVELEKSYSRRSMQATFPRPQIFFLHDCGPKLSNSQYLNEFFVFLEEHQVYQRQPVGTVIGHVGAEESATTPMRYPAGATRVWLVRLDFNNSWQRKERARVLTSAELVTFKVATMTRCNLYGSGGGAYCIQGGATISLANVGAVKRIQNLKAKNFDEVIVTANGRSIALDGRTENAVVLAEKGVVAFYLS